MPFPSTFMKVKSTKTHSSNNNITPYKEYIHIEHPVKL